MRRWLVLLLLAAACSPTPKKGTMEEPIAQPSLQKSAQRALENGHFVWGEWPQEQWWARYHSDELNSLIEEALVCNPDILAVEQKVKAAQNEVIITRSKIFPLIFFDGIETWEYLSRNGLLHALNPNRPRNTNDINLALSVNYEVDIWWKYHNLFYASLGRERAQEAERHQVELVVSTAMAQAYFALKTNLVRQKLYRELYEVRKQFYALIQLLEERALLSRFEPALAQEQLEEVEKEVIAIEAEVLNAQHLINTLRGKGPDCTVVVDPLPLTPPKEMEIPRTLSIELLARRPDLAAATWKALAQSFEVRAAIADFYPNINLIGLLKLSSLDFSQLFEGSSAQPGLVPSFTLPIFTAGAIRSGVRKNTALYNEAVQEYNALLLKSAQEVADLLVLLEAVVKQRKSQNTILERAGLRFDLASLNYAHGLDDMLQVYEKESEWIDKALVDVELIYAQYLTSIHLVKALGGGYRCE